MVLEWAQRLAVVVALVVAALAVRRLDRPRGRWGARLRRRFLLGLPWGTLVAVCVVLAVYLFVQGGLARWYDPVVIPYRAWSYFYLLGMVTAPFSHAGASHLLGNLVGTVVVAPLAEYAWGHYATERGSISFGSWRTNPYARAFVLFPAGVVGVALFTSFFALGPVVGFSGVVFAFVGFALVHYPLRTVVALAAERTVRLFYNALREPTTAAQGHPVFVTPWWADIAIQGHAIGLLAGVVLGATLLHRRDRSAPSALRLLTAVLLVAASEALWAVYWFRGGGRFVLYRAVGTVVVVAVGVVVAVAVGGGERPYVDRAAVALDARGVRDRLPSRAEPDSFADAVRSVTPRQVGMTLLVLSTAVLAGPAIPVNLVTASGDALPGRTVEVRDYEVAYAENVPNGMVSAIDVEAFGESTAVNTSGVIVRSTERGIWTTAVTEGRLAFAGRTRVLLGGLGWREAVLVERDGWTALGGGTTYRVTVHEGGERVPVFTADPATAAPLIAGRNVSVAAGPDRFAIRVTRENRTVGRAPMLARNESAVVGGLRFTRHGGKVYAATTDNQTRVQVFSKETYPGQQ